MAPPHKPAPVTARRIAVALDTAQRSIDRIHRPKGAELRGILTAFASDVERITRLSIEEERELCCDWADDAKTPVVDPWQEEPPTRESSRPTVKRVVRGAWTKR